MKTKTETKQFTAVINFNDDLMKAYGEKILIAFANDILNREFAELSSKCNIREFIYCNREVYDENDWKISERKNKGGYHEQ